MGKINKDKIVQSVPQRGFFGQPKGLFTLFFTEFWERFSYYGMRALLLFYMYDQIVNGGLGIDRDIATSIMAVYGALVYMTGVIGGWIADRLLGTQQTIFYGGILIMIGHIILAMPMAVTGLFLSILFITIGTGLLKPNVSSVVGDMYSEKDTRRDSGFSIFYMGINMGALIAPFVVGTVGQEYNYHLGFSLAAIGMLLGLILFVVTRKKYLGLAGTYVANPLDDGERKTVFKRFGIGAVIVAILLVITIPTNILTITTFTYLVSFLGIAIPTAYFIVMYKSPRTDEVERSRILAYIPLFVASMVFWAIQEQGSIILALYAKERTELSFMGIDLYASWFQSLNPLFIIFLAPVFAAMWVKLGNRQPSTPKKFSLGVIFGGISFMVLIFPAMINGTETLVSPLWLVLSFFLVVLGELCLSPVGLSATTKLAPAAFSAQTMSLWFMSNAAGQAVNAQIVKLYDPSTEIVYFGIIGGIAVLAGIVLFAFSKKIQVYMRGVL
ncbi:peptide MFS transporter [Virgibacillus ihumii]|uniref:peptide MFS transporter n=1 Tax=Virgibacillus ihumii TaxID=2686091 RepID=UPI00157BDE9D|nr:peptide MFS transporter [Virgibacillus ihumii]